MSRIAREYAGLLHLYDRLSERLFHRGQVRVRVRRGQEARIAFLNMDSPGPHRVIEETAQPRLMRKRKVEPGCEVMHPRRHTTLHEESVQ